MIPPRSAWQPAEEDAYGYLSECRRYGRTTDRRDSLRSRDVGLDPGSFQRTSWDRKEEAFSAANHPPAMSPDRVVIQGLYDGGGCGDLIF
jgi:hypothetical protein